MTKHTSRLARELSEFVDDEDRWRAVLEKNPIADGLFFYSVCTTGVYCRNTCAARNPLRKNVRFHLTCKDAEKAGFRPCKRCKPAELSRAKRYAGVAAQACRIIEASEVPPSLDELAQAVGMSRYHFHRIFKSQTGVTPKAYSVAQRSTRVRKELTSNATIATGIHRAGFNSSSRFYESSSEVLGMTPTAFKSGGDGMLIQFAIRDCWLGKILVASSHRGICAIFLGTDSDELTRDLQCRFPRAELIAGDPQFEIAIAHVIEFVSNPSLGLDLPLDIRGTAFQQRVWKALCDIPSGSTARYSEIAEQIGCPRAVRAVANACAANPLAVAVPCHRVVRTDGSQSGYRWGIERKCELLQRERDTADSTDSSKRKLR